MRISRTSVALGALTAVLIGVGIPALGQDAPESILPPGFGDPVAAPAPAPAPRPSNTPRTGTAVIPGPVTPTPLAASTPDAAALAAAQAAALARYELPDVARRSLAVVGGAGPREGALGVNAFGSADGQFVELLMRRLDAPVASRWLSIALRRALVSRVATPPGVNGADFAAERAWLLLRMGESVAARGVVQDVDGPNYTPKMFQVAMQVALATGDPGALCPVADAGAKLQRERAWVVARGICAGLAGEPATSMLNTAERNGMARGIDILLAKKVAGAGSRRQAITIEWDNVEQLSAWRYGLATASGTEIPAALIKTLGPQVQSWRAQSPALEAKARVSAAEQAAVRGVFSNAALVDLYGMINAEDDDSLAELGVARDLRTAYNAATATGRMDMLRQLWDEPQTSEGKVARLILTARAAARIPLSTETPDPDRLIAAMLTAGLDRSAMRWGPKVTSGGDGWAMLALADPDSRAEFSYGDIRDYAPAADTDGLKQQMFFAGMAGLGRMSADEIESGARALDVAIGDQNGWTRAIDRAARLNQPGLVVLLASVGMQTREWRGVPPEVLYRTISSLRAVGMEGEARMIAAEAIARL